MHRVDTPDIAPGGLYRDGNPALGQLATYPDAQTMNALQEEIAHVIEHAGIVLNKADMQQLRKALDARTAQARRVAYFFAHI